MKTFLEMLILSWKTPFTDNERKEFFSWIEEKNQNLKVSIVRNKLSESGFWFYDENKGEIRNSNNSFFQIRGIQHYRSGKLELEQPILIQDEIGYLGIICKEFDGVLCFLMQAKIEPGNVNKIQISPTIQATKSNFTQKHGGRKPAYLDYFLNTDKYGIIVDQIQSEQSSRFLGKRNRNMIIMAGKDEDIEVLPSHKWLTLGQIKELMKYDNLVNMDTRTVISCIPLCMYDLPEDKIESVREMFDDKTMFNSIFCKADHTDFTNAYHYVNDYKMLRNSDVRIIPLSEMKSWNISDHEIAHKEKYPFKVIFCSIEIEGREVTRWTQPLFEAVGMADFGLLMTETGGKKKFLVHALPEAGCFDSIEFAPSVQLEAGCAEEKFDSVTAMFFRKYQEKKGIKTDVILSEEGGRFYCEQNRNIIIEIPFEETGQLPPGYFWLDYSTLNLMAQFNNCLNIQLRNLLSLLEI